jgi:thioredoxin-related protein
MLAIASAKRFPSLIKNSLLSVIGCWLIACSAFADSGINWYRDVDSGFAAGKDAHKLVLVDVYTDWCGYCKKLDEDTFTDPSLINYLNQKFVCVKANAEDHEAGQRLGRQYKVHGFPTALIFDEKGTFLGKFSGYTSAPGYQSLIEKVLNNPVAPETNKSFSSNTKDSGDSSDDSQTNSQANGGSSKTNSLVNTLQKLNSSPLRSLLGRF